jgi:hypothetical protein
MTLTPGDRHHGWGNFPPEGVVNAGLKADLSSMCSPRKMIIPDIHSDIAKPVDN